MDLEELFVCQFQMFLLEVQVTFSSDRDKMDVCMRNFQANDGDGNAFARHGFFDHSSDLLGKYHHLSDGLVVKVEDVIRLLFGDDQGMVYTPPVTS